MPTTKEFNVTEMSCSHCENAIREEVTQLHGVEAAEVSSKLGKLIVSLTDGTSVTDAEILSAVSEAGYEAVAV